MKNQRKPYTDQEDQFIRDNFEEMTDAQIARELERSPNAIKSYRTRKGITDYRHWTAEEEEYLKKHYPDTNSKKLSEEMGRALCSIYNKAQSLGVEKSEEFRNSAESGRIMPGTCHPASVATQFKKGHEPHNKGKTGVWYPGCEESWFKKGHTPHNAKYNGAVSLRIDSKSNNQYMWIRIAESEWIPLQHYNWEKENGPIPEGMILVSINGDTLNTDPDNWELIDRSEHARRNQNHQKAQQTMLANGNHPSINLTDAYIAGILAAKEPELKEHLLNNRPDIIKAARAHYKLKRKLSNYESTAS